MTGKELAEKIKKKQAPFVVDVRSAFEYTSGHIPGAVHIPFWAVPVNVGRLPKDKKDLLVITCEHGPRAQLAKTLLGLIGYRNVEMLDGHMSVWRKASLPLTR